MKKNNPNTHHLMTNQNAFDFLSAIPRDAPPPGRAAEQRKLSQKQAAIMAVVCLNGSITLDDAAKLVGA